MYVCIYVCVMHVLYVLVSVGMCVHTHLCVDTWKSEIDLGCLSFLNFSPPLVLKQSLNLTSLTGPIISWMLLSLFLPPALGLYKTSQRVHKNLLLSHRMLRNKSVCNCVSFMMMVTVIKKQMTKKYCGHNCLDSGWRCLILCF